MHFKSNILTFLLSLSGFVVLSQSHAGWTAFWNQDSTLIGFKGQNNRVLIEPIFTLTGAGKFENIIAVSEEIDGKWSNSYLTMQGKRVARDSVFFFDNSPDCENEGFIRFTDPKSNLVGLLNKKGEVVIPAIYNALSGVRNGMLVALKGAKKQGHDKNHKSECNHFGWTGGQELLVDTLNNTLIENFSSAKSLNFYSLEKSNLPPTDSSRISFVARNGTYYSFTDFEQEFRIWITDLLLNDTTLESFIQHAYDTITWESANGWVKSPKQKLIADNFNILKKGLQEILLPQTDYFVSVEGLNPFMYEGAEFEKYYNTCGESKVWIYPSLSIIISHTGKKDFSQNHYEFLRTDEGYKLISLCIRNENIK